MEKKKGIKKANKTATKKTTTKKVTLKTTNNCKKKKGFTLIELLAVIIILGILMIIAIPSVTKYISDSRKSAYIDTAKEVIGSARNLVNSGNLGMYSTNTTYYIPIECIKTENALKSPYGDFVEGGAYVGVIYDGKGYNYYWISVDDAGQGVRNITRLDKLDIDDIESDLKKSDITDVVEKTGIGNRIEINILKCSNNTWDPIILSNTNNNISEDGGSGGETSSGEQEHLDISYPTGKTKATIVTGDIVTIGTEEFYVVSNSTNQTVLLAKYDLNYTNQQDTSGTNTNIIKVKFAESGYWDSCLSNTIQCTTSTSGLLSPYNNAANPVGTSGMYGRYNTPYPYVYDSGSNLYSYVNDYTRKLSSGTGLEMTGRLMTYDEANNLSTSIRTDMNHHTYWLGNASSYDYVCYVDQYNGQMRVSAMGLNAGVRPVIVF